MQIVIVFIFLFTGIICVSINYASAFKTKNDIVKYIERYGIDKLVDDEDFVQKLIGSGYSDYGDCESGWTGAIDNNGNNQYVFCYREHKNSSAAELETSRYYDIEVFYHISLPFISEVDFKVKGTTKNIY